MALDEKHEKIIAIKNNLNNIKKQCMRAFSSKKRIMEEANKYLDEYNLNEMNKKLNNIYEDNKNIPIIENNNEIDENSTKVVFKESHQNIIINEGNEINDKK